MNNILNKNLYLYIFIISFSIISLLLLIANPGYFSHDEIQKLDHIYKFGLLDYFHSYVKIYVGESFGVPVRPISFAFQGLLALFMENYPIIVHLSAVLMHAFVSCLLYFILIKLRVNKNIAFVSSMIFIISPTSILATGWSAALMDRLYVLFGLLTFILCIEYISNKSKVYLLYILFASILAMLSKETAIILPSLLFILLLKDIKILKLKEFWIAFSTWSLPIIIFLLIRLPSIMNSFGQPSVKSYEASFSNIYDGIFLYFTYPFMINMFEASTWIFFNWPSFLLAISLHLLLILAIYLNFGFKYFIGYLFLYFIFLSPVLLISIKGAHYLYGSGLIFSISIACLFFQNNKFKFFNKGLVVILIIFITVHSYKIQHYIYKMGNCMNTLSITSESIYKSIRKPQKVIFEAEPNSEEHILYKLYGVRNRIGDTFLESLKVLPYESQISDDIPLIIMDKNCKAYIK